MYYFLGGLSRLFWRVATFYLFGLAVLTELYRVWHTSAGQLRYYSANQDGSEEQSIYCTIRLTHFAPPPSPPPSPLLLLPLLSPPPHPRTRHTALFSPPCVIARAYITCHQEAMETTLKTTSRDLVFDLGWKSTALFVVFVWWMSRSSSPLYMVDFSTFEPPEEWKVTRTGNRSDMWKPK